MAKRVIQVGDRVRMTAKFLRSTGQYTGDEAHRTWNVTGLTNGDRWAIVDQPCGLHCFTEAELEADPALAFRRIAVENLQVLSGVQS